MSLISNKYSPDCTLLLLTIVIPAAFVPIRDDKLYRSKIGFGIRNNRARERAMHEELIYR